MSRNSFLIDSIKKEIIELKKENIKFKEQLAKMELQSTNEEINQEMAAMKNENKLLKMEINEVRQMVERIETKTQQQMDELKQNYQQQLEENIKANQENVDLEQIAAYEAHKELADLEIKDFKMKIKELEQKLKNSKFNEEIEWKMQNLLNKPNGTYLYSDAFYSGPSGYRMCLGATVGYNEIDVGFHLMQGESDDKLKWPFTYAVTIDVLDQHNGNVYSSKTIKYIAPAKDWSKPLAERNQKIHCIYVPFNSSAVCGDQITIIGRVDK